MCQKYRKNVFFILHKEEWESFNLLKLSILFFVIIFPHSSSLALVTRWLYWILIPFVFVLCICCNVDLKKHCNVSSFSCFRQHRTHVSGLISILPLSLQMNRNKRQRSTEHLFLYTWTTRWKWKHLCICFSECYSHLKTYYKCLYL